MREEARAKKIRVIEEAAYRLLHARGYEATSMLTIAKASQSSNETLYRWFGDKQGLFRAMVENNVAHIKSRLEAAIRNDNDPLTSLREIAPLLLEMLLGKKAVLLNRAAAGDQSGKLGQSIADGGRRAVYPLVKSLLQRLIDHDNSLATGSQDPADLFLSLLIGDLQIRRVIGVMKEPSRKEVVKRSQDAIDAMLILLRSHKQQKPNAVSEPT